MVKICHEINNRLEVIKKGSINPQISILGFQCVAKNIEGSLKICTSYLVYSQICLNFPQDASHSGCKQKFLKKTLVGTYDSITQVKLAAASLNVFFFGEFSHGDDKKTIHCQLNKEFLWEKYTKVATF
jgi:hypothetical protein